MQTLTVTLVQSKLFWEDIDSNLAMFARKIESIAAPTDIIVLPEMFTTGFSMNAEHLAQTMDGPAVEWLRTTARATQTTIVGSMIIQEEGRYYNRLIWADRDAPLVIYDKKHLFRYAGEEKIYTPGTRLVTVERKGWKIRLFICYDLRFPVWTRNFGLGYDVALFVANWPEKRSAHWRALLRARAIENQSYVIGLNRVGLDGNKFNYSGDSAVIDPTGAVLFEHSDSEIIQSVVLSHENLASYRQTFPAWMDSDQDCVILPG